MMQRLPDAQQHEPKKEKLFFISFMYFEKDTKIWRNLKILFEYVKILSYFCGLLTMYELYMNK